MFRRFFSSAVRVYNKGDVLTLEEAKAGVTGTFDQHSNYTFELLDTHRIEDQRSSHKKSFDNGKVHYVQSSYLDVVSLLDDNYEIYCVDTTWWKATKEAYFGTARRSKSGELLNMYTGSLGKGLTFNHQDFDSIYETLLIAKQNNHRHVVIIQDNKNVVDMLNRSDVMTVPDFNLWKVKVIRRICHTEFEDVKIIHSYRCGNLVADQLSKKGEPDSTEAADALKELVRLDELKQEYIQISKIDR